MTNIAIIFGLLVTPYLVASLFHFNDAAMAVRIGVCTVFLFTAIGHFTKTNEMLPIVPPFVPARRAFYISGVAAAKHPRGAAGPVIHLRSTLITTRFELRCRGYSTNSASLLNIDNFLVSDWTADQSGEDHGRLVTARHLLQEWVVKKLL